MPTDDVKVLSEEEIAELDRLEREVQRVNQEIAGARGIMDSVSGARLEKAHDNWSYALKAAAPSLLASARRCAQLEAFLAEHGEATQRALKVAYFCQGATGEQQAEWDEAHRELRELRWIR